MKKFRAEVAGIMENTWSSNGVEFDSIEQAKEWLDKLSGRWFGYDLGRVVSVDIPRGEKVNIETDDIYQNFRK